VAFAVAIVDSCCEWACDKINLELSTTTALCVAAQAFNADARRNVASAVASKVRNCVAISWMNWAPLVT
jgi:hypothetical protein